jgi:hypothetical protein
VRFVLPSHVGSGIGVSAHPISLARLIGARGNVRKCPAFLIPIARVHTLRLRGRIDLPPETLTRLPTDHVQGKVLTQAWLATGANRPARFNYRCSSTAFCYWDLLMTEVTTEGLIHRFPPFHSCCLFLRQGTPATTSLPLSYPNRRCRFRSAVIGHRQGSPKDTGSA